MPNEISILFIGDIVGAAGRKVLSVKMTYLVEATRADFVIANVENAAGGLGLTPEIADNIQLMGVDVLTSGNHIWDKKEILPYMEKSDILLRPVNYPPGVPGRPAARTCRSARSRGMGAYRSDRSIDIMLI